MSADPTDTAPPANPPDPPALAAPPMEPYVVTSAEDDGPGTLRDAMRQAAASEGQQQP